MLNKSNTIDQLLDKRLNNERSLLLFLTQKKGVWVPTSELAVQLNLSIDSILRTIKDLNDDIAYFHQQKFRLDFSKGRGVRFSVRLGENVQELLTVIIKKSPTIRLMEHIYTETFYNVNHYAAENYTSAATVRRHLNKLKQYFRSYDVTITRETAALTGNETQIRVLAMIFFWQVYGGVSWPFQTINEYEMEKLVIDLLAEITVDTARVPLAYQRQLMYYFAESILRTRKKKFVAYESHWDALIENSHTFSIFRSSITKFLGIIYPKEEEIIFHYIIFLSMSTTSQIVSKESITCFIDEQRKKNTSIFQASELLIKKIGLNMHDYSEKKQTRLISYIYSSHIFACYLTGFNSDLAGNILSEELKKSYPILFNKITVLIENLQKESQIDLFKEKAFLIVPYTKLFHLIYPLSYYETEINVLIENDNPFILTKQISEQLSGYFQNKYNIRIIDSFELHEEDSIDLVLTTFSFDLLNKKYRKADILTVNKHLSYSDYQILENLFKKIVIKKDKDLPSSLKKAI